MRHLRRMISGLWSMRAAAAGGAVLLALLGAIYFWPMPASLNGTLQGTTTLVDIRGREIAELPSVDARAQFPRELPDLGPWLPKVSVALEDHRFYNHGAVDWRGIGAALFRNVKSGCIISGGSTITQQLAKLARGRRHRGVLQKIDEAVVAWKLEHRWGKERILAEYLNRSSFGNRRLGPEAAARAYFGKSARELTLAESIFLGGLPQAPSRFNPWRHAVDANRRYTR